MIADKSYSSTRYVDYAMHRMRLLRHHKIEPYVVFDGGPLPAKKGTEIERRQRREESLARGNALTAQGKHSQARECYVKCVDITPQMAYQLIKASYASAVTDIIRSYVLLGVESRVNRLCRGPIRGGCSAYISRAYWTHQWDHHRRL